MKPAKPIKRVVIVGGTHGNELTGVYLVKRFEKFPALIQRTSFECFTLLANPKAFEQNQRYVEQDLNRCFSPQELTREAGAGMSYEAKRAQTIYQQFVLNERSRVDFIIDLHSTTANMGLTLIPSSFEPFNLKLAAYLCDRDPSVKVYAWPQSSVDMAVLRSICPLGCAIEMGPVAQGVINTTILQRTETAVIQILDYIEAYNCGTLPAAAARLTAYQALETIDYPRNSRGDLQATIHPALQSQDYAPIAPGDPMFLGLDQETIPYAGPSVVYPTFINEAAYYEKGIAMCLTKKQHFQLPAS